MAHVEPILDALGAAVYILDSSNTTRTDRPQPRSVDPTASTIQSVIREQARTEIAQQQPANPARTRPAKDTRQRAHALYDKKAGTLHLNHPGNTTTGRSIDISA